MARRHTRSRSRHPDTLAVPFPDDYVVTETRDPRWIASARPDTSRPALTFRLSPLLVSGRSLLAIEDRRTFDPNPYRPAGGVRNRRHRLAAPLNAKGAKRPQQPPRSGLRLLPGFGARVSAPPQNVAFRAPQSVLVCVRRGRRREVLFAKKRAGRAPKRLPRWSTYSKISCRRR